MSTQESQREFSLKLRLRDADGGEDEVRRTRCNGVPRFSFLQEIVANAFVVSKFALFYRDEDGDMCRVTSDAELAEVFELAATAAEKASRGMVGALLSPFNKPTVELIVIRKTDTADVAVELQNLQIDETPEVATAAAAAAAPVAAEKVVTNPSPAPAPAAAAAQSATKPAAEVPAWLDALPAFAKAHVIANPDLMTWIAMLDPAAISDVVVHLAEAVNDEAESVQAYVTSNVSPSTDSAAPAKTVSRSGEVPRSAASSTVVPPAVAAAVAAANAAAAASTGCCDASSSTAAADGCCRESSPSTVAGIAAGGCCGVPGDVRRIGGNKCARTAERSTPAFAVAGGAVHDRVTCDGCGVTPIRGKRWKCGNCADFDFCSACEETRPHEASHVFLCIKTPLASTSFTMMGRSPLLRANLYDSGRQMQFPVRVVDSPHRFRHRRRDGGADEGGNERPDFA